MNEQSLIKALEAAMNKATIKRLAQSKTTGGSDA